MGIVSKLTHHHEGILARGVKAFLNGYGLVSAFQKKLLCQMVLFGGVEKKPLLPPLLRSFLSTKKKLFSDSSFLEPRGHSNGKNLSPSFPLSVSGQSPNHHEADGLVAYHGKEGQGQPGFKPPGDRATIRPIHAEDFSAQPGEEIFVGLFRLANRGRAFHGEKEVRGGVSSKREWDTVFTGFSSIDHARF